MKKLLFIVLGIAFIITSCNDTHFITDESYREQVNKDFLDKKKEINNDRLYTVFDKELTTEEQEALEFLYAYMPVGDISDYDGDLYLESVKQTLQTRNEMSWGKQIPETVFRHFVLPLRVNNENLDRSRVVFYDELKNRVKDLSLMDAALEVNHWCHEKAVYRPSDMRTRSPMATVKTAFGRCGEESTFAVAALRAVGIPARQVYTPRWAHTDDNHAWVEVWVDGKWYFLGACEPEPVLNMAWFNAPVARGMLMRAKVFGKYNGPEDIMKETAGYTEVNVTDNYAATAEVTILVVDKNDKPVEDALVEFKIYNYAEFFSVAKKATTKEGKATLAAGKGDMLVWASKEGKFGFKKVSFAKEATYKIMLEDEAAVHDKIFDLDIIPPKKGLIPIEVTEQQKEENAKRLTQEDRIRQAYERTFYSAKKAADLAKKLSLDKDALTKIMLESRGNWRAISQFLKNTPSKNRKRAMDLLNVISTKDLKDTEMTVLADHLIYSKNKDSELFTTYILNPRVANELLTSYKAFFQKNISQQEQQAYQADPHKLFTWVKDNIKINPKMNPQRVAVMPKGVWKSRVADEHSRDIFFVALARSLGIPARIETVTGKPQYYKEKWISVDFKTVNISNEKTGTLATKFTPTKTLKDPSYYTHFTIAKIRDNGTLQTLNYEAEDQSTGWGEKWKKLFKKPLSLEVGEYVLITGTRMADGSVLSQLSFFEIKAGKNTVIDLTMRQSKEKLQVLGSINAEEKFMNLAQKKSVSILSTTGRGYYIIGILGVNKEPTNHALNDISLLQKDFEAWGRSMIMLFPTEKDAKRYRAKKFPNLPNTITYGVDKDSKITNMIAKAVNLHKQRQLPIFVVADTLDWVRNS